MSLREKMRQLVESKRFQHAIMTVIIINAVTLGLETSPRLNDQTQELLGYLDRLALSVFVVELLMKFFVYRLRFFRDPWNCFDFVVVGIALVPATGAFAVLRALRVLRVLRLISVVPSMRRVVSTLLAAIPGASSIVALLILVIYVSAVMSTKLFGEASPDHFGDLGTSLWTLFQVMTGEAWPDIAEEVMEHNPAAWIFFLLFILISTFVVLNLFLAVMVSAMESVRDQEAGGSAASRPVPPGGPDGTSTGASNAGVAEELAALRREVAALRGLLTGPESAAPAAPSEPTVPTAPAAPAEPTVPTAPAAPAEPTVPRPRV